MITASEASGSSTALGEASGEGTAAEYFGPFDAPPEGSDPEDYVLCGDEKWYRKRIVSGTVAIVGTSSMHPGSIRRAERIEAAIHAAIMKAVSEGILQGTPELTAIIDAARDAAMNE